LLSFTSYARQMKALANFRLMKRADRDELLGDLYDIAKSKAKLENYAEGSRREAKELRKWKKFLQSIPQKLTTIAKEIVWLGKRSPAPSDLELLFDGEDIRRALYDLVDSAVKTTKLAVTTELSVIAIMNPQFRTKAEKKRLPKELVLQDKFPVSEKSPAFDLLMIKLAAERLEKSRDRNGNKIPGYELIIWNLFKAALGEQNRTVDAIRKQLLKPAPKPR
jgi:hypothetical protein